MQRSARTWYGTVTVQYPYGIVHKMIFSHRYGTGTITVPYRTIIYNYDDLAVIVPTEVE